MFFMNKEQLNSKFKEIIKQDGISAKKINEKSGMFKKMNPAQKMVTLGMAGVAFIVIIVLTSRLMHAQASIRCVVEAPKLELAFNSAGKVAGVAYSEKQTVFIKDIIAWLENEAYIAELESAARKSLEADLELIKMEDRFADMRNALAEAELKAAESANKAAILAFALARENERQHHLYLRNKTISRAHYISSLADVSNAEVKIERTENELEKAKQRLEAVKKGYTPEETTSAKQEAEAAAEQVAKAKADLDGTVIEAPYYAYISRINVNAGDNVEPGDIACEILDLSKIWLRGLADKATAESLTPGTVVHVKFDKFPERAFTGRIVSITDEYDLRIELDNPSRDILPEMEAAAIVVQ